MGRFCIYSSFGSLPMAEIIKILFPGVSLALGDLSGSTKPSWPSGWPARAKVYSESKKKELENQMFTICKGSHSLTTPWQSLHSTVDTDLRLLPGCSPPPLIRFVMLMVLVMLIDIFVFMYASGVSRLQPDKRGTASGRLLHQPTHLSGSRCYGVNSLCWLPVRNHLSLLPPIASQRGCSHCRQLASS